MFFRSLIKTLSTIGRRFTCWSIERSERRDRGMLLLFFFFFFNKRKHAFRSARSEPLFLIMSQIDTEFVEVLAFRFVSFRCFSCYQIRCQLFELLFCKLLPISSRFVRSWSFSAEWFARSVSTIFNFGCRSK